MSPRIRSYYLIAIMTFASLLLGANYTGQLKSVETEPQNGLPIASFNGNGSAYSDLVNPENQSEAIEQALLNAWQWMPDYSRNQPQPREIKAATNGMIAYEKIPEHQIYLTDPNDNIHYSLSTDLPSHYNFEWSPGEEYLAFVGREENGAPCLYRLDVATRTRSSLACGFVEIWEPRWSPDGKNIVFYALKVDNDESSIWFIPSQGGMPPTRLASGLPLATHPSWLDLTKVLFSGRANNRAYAVYRVDIRNPNSQQAITPFFDPSGCEGTFTAYPEISPDRKWVAFAAVHPWGGGKSSSCAAGVYVVDPRGSTDPALKGDVSWLEESNQGQYGRLRWNPNSPRVGVMGSGGNNTLRLYVINVGSPSEDITELKKIQGGSFSLWDWSPDGKLMASGHKTDNTDWVLYSIDPVKDEFSKLQDGFDPAWSSRPVDPPVDLIGTRLEITQAIQDQDNSIPLVEGKSTWIRFYVRSAVKTVNEVGARLIVTRDGVEQIYTPVNQRVVVNSAGSSPDDPAQTFNFLLPLDETHGEITVRAEVGPGQQFRETDYNNNYYPRRSNDALKITFQPTTQIIIHVYPFRFIMPNGEQHVGSITEANYQMEFMQWTYPLAEGSYQLTNGKEIPINAKDYNLSDPRSWINLISMVKGTCPVSKEGSDRCISLIPGKAMPTQNRQRWGQADNPVAIFVDNYPSKDLRSLAAHEIGHTYGLKDPPENSLCLELGGYGFHGSELSQAVYSPNQYYSLMNDTERCKLLTEWHWISSSDFRHLFGRLQTNDLERAGAGQVGHLVISGAIVPEQNGELWNLYEITRDSNYDTSEGSGPYTLELFDTNSQTLFIRHFEGILPEGDQPVDLIGFIEEIPRPENLTRVILREGAKIYDEIVISPNAPEIQLDQTLNGQTIDKPKLVSWTASDPDGDALIYSVEYSSDQGTTWQPIAVILSEQSFIIDPAYLAGTTQGKIRVRASDGLNTNESISEGIFTIPPHSPLVTIQSPKAGRHPAWVQLELVASAYDREDGLLPDTAFVWSLNGNKVGTGRMITLRNVAYGHHIVSLVVTDSSGRSTQDEVQVTITDFPRQLFLPVSVNRK
jgi:Tol biopolymer transport system component